MANPKEPNRSQDQKKHQMDDPNDRSAGKQQEQQSPGKQKQQSDQPSRQPQQR